MNQPFIFRGVLIAQDFLLVGSGKLVATQIVWVGCVVSDEQRRKKSFYVFSKRYKKGGKKNQQNWGLIQNSH